MGIYKKKIVSPFFVVLGDPNQSMTACVLIKQTVRGKQRMQRTYQYAEESRVFESHLRADSSLVSSRFFQGFRVNVLLQKFLSIVF